MCRVVMALVLVVVAGVGCAPTGDLLALSCDGYDLAGNGDGVVTADEVRAGAALFGLTFSDAEIAEFVSMCSGL